MYRLITKSGSSANSGPEVFNVFRSIIFDQCAQNSGGVMILSFRLETGMVPAR